MLTKDSSSIKKTEALHFHHYVQRPEHIDMEKIHQAAVALAREIESIQERPQSIINRQMRKFSVYQTTASNWMRNKLRDIQGREDLLPLFFLWTVTRTCNFYCDYCCDHRGNKYPDLSNKDVLDTPKAKKLINIMRTRAPAIYYAGGEPTTRADLPALVRHARDKKYFPQIINTNGSLLDKLLVRSNWSTFLADMDIIIVSLDGLNVNQLNQTYRYARSQDVIRNILALRELRQKFKFKLMINCVVRPGKVQDAIDVLNWANDLDITFSGVPVNDGPNIKKGLTDDPEYRHFVDLLLTRHQQKKKFAGSMRMNRRLYNSEPLNCRNTLKPHIDFDGRLFWPCKACVNVPPAMINVLDYNHVDEIWKVGRTLISPDKFHGPSANQCGANCNWAQNYSTDSYYHGIKHPLSMIKDIKDFLQ